MHDFRSILIKLLKVAVYFIVLSVIGIVVLDLLFTDFGPNESEVSRFAVLGGFILISSIGLYFLSKLLSKF